MSKFPEKTWISPKIEVRKSRIGKGMFAKEPINKGEIVIIWGGDYTNTEGVMQVKEEGKLVMQWAEDVWTVESRGDEDAYFVNHSCDPNLWMKDISTLVARRNITKDEELTADYVMWEADENYVSKWECSCGSSLCRKRITGKDWRLLDLQERYKGHFSFLINNRIENFVKI